MSYLDKILNEISFSFARSSGSGGQNVNKVNTKALLSWPIAENENLDIRLIKRFEKKYQKFIYDGVFKISSQRYRSQQMNKEDCLEKLKQMLVSASKEPRKRKKTKPSKSAIEKRIKNKKLNSVKKNLRSEKHY